MMPSSDDCFRLKLQFESPPPGMPASTKYVILVMPDNCKTIYDLELQIIRKFGYSKGATVSLSLDHFVLPSTEDIRVLSHNDCIWVAILQETRIKEGKKRKTDTADSEVAAAKKAKAAVFQSKRRAAPPAQTSSKSHKMKLKNPAAVNCSPTRQKKEHSKSNGQKTKPDTSQRSCNVAQEKQTNGQKMAERYQAKKRVSSSESSSDSSSSPEDSKLSCLEKKLDCQNVITAKIQKGLRKPAATLAPASGKHVNCSPTRQKKEHSKLNGQKNKPQTSQRSRNVAHEKQTNGQQMAEQYQAKKRVSSSESSSDSSSSPEDSKLSCLEKLDCQNVITAKIQEGLRKPAATLAPARGKPGKVSRPVANIQVTHAAVNCGTKVTKDSVVNRSKNRSSSSLKQSNNSNAHHVTFESGSSDSTNSDLEVAKTKVDDGILKEKKSEALNFWLKSADCGPKDWKKSSKLINGEFKDPGISTNISKVFQNPPLDAGNVETRIEPEKPSRDYSSLLPLSWPPRKNDVFVYKMLQMSQDYTPVISDYNEATVLEVLPSKTSPTGVDSVKVTLIWPKSHRMKREGGRFEMDLEEEEAEVTESSELILEWKSLLDPKRIE